MLKQTPLYENHRLLNAKFVSFAGWQMPLYYKGIHKEVLSVRSNLGLFDVSHMGRVSIRGKDTLPYLEHLSANTVLDKPFKKAFYTVFCNRMGRVIDDLLVYLEDQEHAFIVVNASTRESDLRHLKRESAHFAVHIEPRYENEGIISLQGPKSHEILRGVPSLSPFEFAPWEKGITISRTGYTGEEGYEFFGPAPLIKALWNMLLEKGKPLGLEPCGLGARDILRLEMGYALYGHELSETIYPQESVAAWTVKLDAHDFVGKKGLIEAENEGHLRHPIALLGMEQIPAREGYPIFFHNNQIGKVTSGAFSPTLNRPIALGMIQELLPEKERVDVLIRNSYHPFEIVKLPFIKRPK